MRTILVAVAAVLTLVAGCGKTDDPGPGGKAVEHTVVKLVSGYGGGAVEGPAILSDPNADINFLKQFGHRPVGNQIRNLIATTHAPSGQVLMGAVIGFGCIPPTGVDVRRTKKDLVFTPTGTPTEDRECEAPVTTVALVLVDADAL